MKKCIIQPIEKIIQSVTLQKCTCVFPVWFVTVFSEMLFKTNG